MQVSEISELPSPASRVTLRAAQPPDAEQCGKVAYEAHQAVSAAHNFSAEVPSVDLAIGMMTGKLKDPHARGLVAERAGQVIGSVFLTGFPPTPIAAIGPLTVLPSEQGKVGRQYGLGNRALPDGAVLAAAHLEERGLLRLNRKHFWRLHESGVGRRGIVACTFDPDFERQARRIDLD